MRRESRARERTAKTPTQSRQSTGRPPARTPRAVTSVVIAGGAEPRLRFDRTAVGLVRRLEVALAATVPVGRVVMVTVTAPIRQDSKTGKDIETRIRDLLATRRRAFHAIIHDNRVEVRVLRGGASQTPRVVGFVHNPEPDAEVLFDVARRLLAALRAQARAGGGRRALVIRSRTTPAAVRAIEQVCAALHARRVFGRIVVTEGTRAPAR